MRFTRVVIPVALCILLLGFAAPAQRKKYSRAAKPQAPLPVVSAIDTDALKGLITQQRERPLLVNFWATFCDPCRDEFPDLVKIDKEYRPNSLDFVTVSLDDIDQLKTDVPKFLSSMKATMPAYLLNVSDPEPAINFIDRKWQGDLPATYLYNEKGELVYKHIGRVNTAELREAIEKAVKKGDGQ